MSGAPVFFPPYQGRAVFSKCFPPAPHGRGLCERSASHLAGATHFREEFGMSEKVESREAWQCKGTVLDILLNGSRVWNPSAFYKLEMQDA